MEILDFNTFESTSTNLKKGRKIAGHVSFFKVGVSSSKTLVCAVRSTALSTTIKVLEPLPSVGKGSGRKKGFDRLFGSNKEGMRVFKVFI